MFFTQIPCSESPVSCEGYPQNILYPPFPFRNVTHMYPLPWHEPGDFVP